MSRYDWGQAHPGIPRLEKDVDEARRQVIAHPIYANLDNHDAVVTFPDPARPAAGGSSTTSPSRGERRTRLRRRHHQVARMRGHHQHRPRRRPPSGTASSPPSAPWRRTQLPPDCQSRRPVRHAATDLRDWLCGRSREKRSSQASTSRHRHSRKHRNCGIRGATVAVAATPRRHDSSCRDAARCVRSLSRDRSS